MAVEDDGTAGVPLIVAEVAGQPPAVLRAGGVGGLQRVVVALVEVLVPQKPRLAAVADRRVHGDRAAEHLRAGVGRADEEDRRIELAEHARRAERAARLVNAVAERGSQRHWSSPPP